MAASRLGRAVSAASGDGGDIERAPGGPHWLRGPAESHCEGWRGGAGRGGAGRGGAGRGGAAVNSAEIPLAGRLGRA